MINQEFMQPDPSVARKGNLVSDTRKKMKENNFRLIYVVDNEDKLSGFITYDSIKDEDENQKIDGYISRANLVVKNKEPIDKAVSLIKEHKLMVLPVVDQDRVLVGVITPGKLFERFSELLRLGEGGFWITLELSGLNELFRVVDVFKEQQIPLHNILTSKNGEGLQMILKAGDVQDRSDLKRKLGEALNG